MTGREDVIGGLFDDVIAGATGNPVKIQRGVIYEIDPEDFMDDFHQLPDSRPLRRLCLRGCREDNSHQDDGRQYFLYVFHCQVRQGILSLDYGHIQSGFDKLDDKVKVVSVKLTAESLGQVSRHERDMVIL